MTAGAVTIGRKQYAIGLYWENSPSGRISQAAKEAARQSSSPVDYYVTRSGSEQGRVPQFGLAPRNAQFRPGMPSLAGCLATQQPGDWIGAFKFHEGTALVICRDDLIVPDGDLFFVDEAEARDRFLEELAIGGFQRTFAPESWGISGADTMPVTLLLNDNASIKLRSVVLSRKAKALLLIGGTLLALATGAGLYIQDQLAKEEEARQAQMEALERARSAAEGLIPGMSQKPNYPPPERFWEARPRPLEIIEVCQTALSKVTIGVAGWTVSTIYCNENALTIIWNRKSGFSSTPQESVISDDGATATRVVPVGPLKPRGPEELVDPEVVTKRYLNQNWTGSIARTADDPPPPPPPNYNGEWNPPPAPWVKRSFTLTVPVLPWTLPDFLTDLPGVIVRGMTQNSGGGWTTDGVIYENRR